jgi:RND family efflux transporter MFP subunit
MFFLRIPLFLLALGGITALGCGSKETRPRQVDRCPSLETVQPTRTLLPLRIELSATIEPLEKADLCARIPGVVKFLPPEVDIGRRVTAGEKLLELDVPELEAQERHKQALLDQAQKQEALAHEALKVAAREVEEAEKQEKRYAAEYDFAKFQNDRVSELVRRSTVSAERGQETQRQLEAAKAAWEASQAQIQTKKARLEATRADIEVARSKVEVARAEVHNVQKLLGFAVIKAPFDGVITKRWVDRGATVKDAGTPLLTVMNTDTVRVLLDVPEKHVPLISALGNSANPGGQRDPVELRIPSLRETPTKGIFPGTVTRLAGALDPNTRTMRTEVHLDNRDGYLKPGMFGTAKVTLAERPYVLTVPASALARRGEEIGVYIVEGIDSQTQRGVARWVPLELGLDDGLRVEVRKGLQGTEQVIAKGNGVVREGDTVRAVPATQTEF